MYRAFLYVTIMLTITKKDWSKTMPEIEQTNTAVKEVEVDGYRFSVDTDLLDDVETFELIDRIENKNQIAAIVPLLEFIIGPDAYQQMKTYFTKIDAEAHKDQKDYKPRFRLSKLQSVYLAIVEKFNPKV